MGPRDSAVSKVLPGGYSDYYYKHSRKASAARRALPACGAAPRAGYQRAARASRDYSFKPFMGPYFPVWLLRLLAGVGGRDRVMCTCCSSFT